MRRATVALSLLALFAGGVPVLASPPGLERYVVVLRDGVSASRVSARHERAYGLTLHHVYGSAIRGYSATIPSTRVAEVREDPQVAYLSPDLAVRAAPKGRGSTDALPLGVDRINAEERGNTGLGVNVAVLDTGIDVDHPDLVDNIAGGKNCSSGPSFDDGNGHGTDVAGTIAAGRNGFGVFGVAPDAGLWAVRVLNNGGLGSTSSVVCGIDFVDSLSPAKGGPISVANMSLSGFGADDGQCGTVNGDAEHQAICAAVSDGVTFVAAAGNSGGNIASEVPAAYDEVLTVSALADSTGSPCGGGVTTNYGPDDTFASFSNFAGPADAGHIIGAPGVNIRSTTKNGRYGFKSGTSMASPHVAGAAALYLQGHPGAGPSEVMNSLLAVAEPPDVSFGGECATGFSHTDPSELHPEPVVRADAL